MNDQKYITTEREHKFKYGINLKRIITTSQSKVEIALSDVRQEGKGKQHCS